VTPAPPPARDEDQAQHHSRGSGLIVTVLLVAAAAAVYLALAAASGDGIPRGTTVLGVDIGGQSEEQAAKNLSKALKDTANTPIDLRADGNVTSVTPLQAGLSLDLKSTVAGQASRRWNPIDLVAQFLGTRALDPVIVVDQSALSATVAGIAADVDSAAKEPRIRLVGQKASLTPGAKGSALDQKAAAEAIRAAYLVATEPTDLAIVVVPPIVSDEEAKAGLASARIAFSGPVSVTVSDLTTSIPVTAIAAALSYEAKDGKFVPVLDGDILRASIAPAIASVEKPGRDATWDVSSGKPVVVPAKVGRGVNADKLAVDVAAVLDKADPAQRHVDARIGTIDPKLTTEKAKSLGVIEMMSSFKQHFPYAAYRVQNIGTAAKYIDRTLLLPGETFSLNKTIKERTPENGYTKGFVIGAGGVFKEDLGGGVSTSATTTWTAAFFAGLQRVHTQAHSIWIPRYRAGLEATVAWGSFDMSFKNDTPHAVFITTNMQNTSLTVTIWGTKVYDRIDAVSGPRYDVFGGDKILYDTSSTCHPQTGLPGFTIDVYRVFMKDRMEAKREKITTKYSASPTVNCFADPAIKPTPSPTPTVPIA